MHVGIFVRGVARFLRRPVAQVDEPASTISIQDIAAVVHGPQHGIEIAENLDKFFLFPDVGLDDCHCQDLSLHMTVATSCARAVDSTAASDGAPAHAASR